MVSKTSKLILVVILLIFSEHSLANESGGILREKSCFGEAYEGFIDSQTAESGYSGARRDGLEELIRSRVNEKEFQELQANFTCKVIVYKSGEYPVGGILLTPNTENGQKLPAVIFNRGGNGRFGALNYLDIFLYLKPLADMGVAVLATQYRGGMEVMGGP